MSTSTSSQQLLGPEPSNGGRPDTEGHAVRPQPALLKLLRTVGATGDTFTLKQVMHFLGQYIMVKQLFDKQQQHIVHCGTDELGKLLGITTFSIKDPSPIYVMLKKNLSRVSCTDAAQSSSRDQMQDTGGLERQKNYDESRKEVADIGVTSSPSPNLLAEVDENPDILKLDRLDLSFEEWDCAGLPWWFLGNLRANYNPLSNGSTDIPSNQDIDTALVSDTTDDLWFLNDSRSDQINVEAKVESMDSQDAESEDVRDDEGKKKVIELTIYGDDLDDTQCLSDTDTEIESEDCWQCTNCHKFNSPSKRYCFRCWALRKDWYADCPPLTHTLSTPTVPANVRSLEMNGIDIPDCRRTVSAPMLGLKNNENKFKVPFLEPLDLASNVLTLSESTETLLGSEEASLESSRPLLELCRLCHRRPRDGNIVHGRTAHLVTCFLCACNLKKTRKGCLVCQKPIQMVVKIYMA